MYSKTKTAENICKNVPGPRGATRYAKVHEEVFILFFIKNIIKNIVHDTNAVIQPTIEIYF